MDDQKILQIVLQARDNASDTVDKLGGKLGGLGAFMASSFKNAAIVSGVALGGLTVAAVVSTGAFDDAQKTLAQTTAVLKSTKDAVGLTQEQLDNLSKAQEAQTTYSHDQVMQAENLLLTFTDIGKNVFPQTTQTVLDVATAMHEDLQSAAIQVGKAMQDPATGMTQLHRIGVNFTADQIKLAKQMQATGDIAGAQAMVLKELGNEFGGSAAAQAGTFAGQMQQLKNDLTDVEEVFGGFIEKALSPLIDKFQLFFNDITDLQEGVTNLSGFTAALSEHFGTVGKVIGSVITFFQTHREVVIALAGAFAGVLTIALLAAAASMLSFIVVSLPVLGIFAALGAGIALVVTHWSTFRPMADQVMKALQEVGGVISNFVGVAIVDVKAFITQNQQYFQEFFTIVIDIFTFALGFLKGFWDSTWQALGGTLKVIWQVFANIVRDGWEVIQGIIDILFGIFTGKWDKVWQGVKEVFGGVWSALGDIVTGAVEIMINGIKLAADVIIGVINGIINGVDAVASHVPGGVKIPEIPKFQDGGWVPKTGLAILHQGEFVMSKAMLNGQHNIPQQVMSSNTNNMPINIYATVSGNQDMNYLANQIAFAIKNSR